MPPRVSVIIPFHQAAGTLDATVRSVARQSMTDWELLLVDDGSTDAGPALAAAWKRRLPGKVRLLRHPGGRDLGPFASRMLGARRARAGVLALLDADDLWQPRYLERHLAYWDAVSRKGVALSYGPARYWFPGEPRRDFTHGMPAPGKAVFAPGGLLQNFLSTGFGTVPRTCAALLKRSCVLTLGAFAEDARRAPRFEDMFLMWGLAARWPVAIHDGAWARYRQRCAPEDRPRVFYEETLRDEKRFLPVIGRYIAKHLSEHPLLGPDGIAARLAALRRRGRRSPFGDYFFERVPEDLRALATARA